MLTLEAEWKQLAGRYSTDEALIQRLFGELVAYYTESGRHYHNLTHISALLQCIETYVHTLHDPDAVRFAAWFHDVVYQSLRSDNEERSAHFAQETLIQLGFPAKRAEDVLTIILRTRNHTERKPEETPDTQFFLDADLAILGADFEKYQQYAGEIRKEYAIYPDMIYNPGRRKVFRHFLASPSIYRTPAFQDLYERQARQNLETELARLS